MADRTVSVHLKAEVATYIARIRQAGRETERFADRIERSTRRLPGEVSSHRHAMVRAGEQLGDGVADGYRRRVVKVEKDTEKVAKRSQRKFHALATAIIAGLPAASSAAFGLLSLGGTAAFIGLGAVALRENERILESYRELGRMVAGNLADDAAVMEDAFVGAAEQMGQAFQQLRPQLRSAFAASAPHVETLTQGVIDFAQNAMPGMLAAVERADPIMEGFRSLLADTGQGVGDVFDTIAEHGDTTGRGVENLGELIQGLLTGTATVLVPLSELWAEHGDEVAEVITQLLEVIGGLTGSALPVLSSAVGVALDAFSGILNVLEPLSGVLGPMIGTWLSLAAAMRTMRAVEGVIGGVATSVRNLGKSSDGAARSVGGLSKAGMVAAAALVALPAIGEALNGIFGEKLNANVDELGDSLAKFGRSGRLTGEAARVAGGDVEELGWQFGRLMRWDAGIAEFFEGLAGGLDDADGSILDIRERIGALDEALAGMVSSGNAEKAREAFLEIAEAAKRQGADLDEVTALLPQYGQALSDAGTPTDDLATQTGRLNSKLEDQKTNLAEAKSALEGYIDAQRQATDPVFRLRDAIQGVDEAEKNLNKALKEHKRTSPEVEAATWDLAEAVSAAEQAALDGDLSFDKFRNKLKSWVKQGLITKGQADRLAGRVKNLRGEAEDYQGTYGAKLKAETEAAKRKIKELERRLNRLDGKTANTFITTYLDTIVRGPKKKPSANIPGIPFAADGGRFGLGDMAVVGEEGPELVRFSGPSEVIPHRESMRMLQQEGRVIGSRDAVIGAPGGAMTVIHKNVTVHVPNYVGSHDELARTIRKTVSNEGGGNVQATFGRG